MPEKRTRTWVKVGLFYRKEIREFFLTRGTPFTEHKSWTESLFIYEGTNDDIKVIEWWVRRINA